MVYHFSPGALFFRAHDLRKKKMHTVYSSLRGFLICDFDGYGLDYGYTSGGGSGSGENDFYNTSDLYLEFEYTMFSCDIDEWTEGDGEVVYLDLSFDGMEE